jgi:ketosteroid isomerase-like protein
MSNLPRLKQLYEAFRVRDIATFLQFVREDVDWQYGGNSTNVPWLTEGKGHAGVLAYVKAFAQTEVSFTTKAFLEEGRVCVVLLDIDVVVKANGMKIHEEDAAHIFHFDEKGLIQRFRSRADTAAHEKAYNYKPAGA